MKTIKQKIHTDIEFTVSKKSIILKQHNDDPSVFKDVIIVGIESIPSLIIELQKRVSKPQQ